MTYETNTNKYKLLIVDDDAANLKVLNHILKDEYKLFMAKSGSAAVKTAEKVRPDLILLDILMPDMDGFEVLGVLQKSDLTRGIPVIFITGLSQSEHEDKGLALGAVDYIKKPFDRVEVMARVGRQLGVDK
ncbi:MAG: response regulator [Oscillospiraceae bacterium]|nr:response regulator [Oscillospiraceae bacterium]